jgi:uncharacterized FlgJ-related protein
MNHHAAGGIGALHKIDGSKRKEKYVDILKQHLKTSVRKLKLGHKWVFQMDNDPKHTGAKLSAIQDLYTRRCQSKALKIKKRLWPP